MKSLASSLFFMLMVQTLLGQTITDIIPQPGQTFGVTHNFSYANPGPAGAGVTWDFTDLDFSNESQVSVMAGQGAPSGEMFPENAIVLSWPMSSDGSFISYTFFDFSQNSWVHLGSSLNTGSYNVYENPAEIITLPLTPESYGADTYAFIEDLFIFERVWTGTSEWEVDGSGTLILPNATYDNVLRVHTQTTELGLWEGEDLQVEINRTTYRWYVDGIPHPLLTLIEETLYDVDEDETLYFEYGEAFIAFNTVSVDEQNPKYSPEIFPNPVVDRLHFKSPKDFGKALSYAICDLAGRTILRKDVLVSPESVTGIDVSFLHSGIYILRVENVDHISASPFVKL